MHGNGLLDNETILDELANGLARVCVGDFRSLVGVEPDLSLTTANNVGREALLGGEVGHAV